MVIKGVLSEDDLKYIKSQILYPIVLDTLEHDMKNIKENKLLKFADLYVMKLKSVINNYTRDAFETRNYLRKYGIKILTETRTKERLVVAYICRGYTSESSMLWDYVKSEVSLILCKYLEIDITDDKLR